MSAVDEAERHKEQTSFDVDRRVHRIVDIGLFNLNLASIARTGDGMFNLDFTVETDLIIEAMPEKQHETLQIGLVAAPVAQIAIVANLAIAADGGVGLTPCRREARRRCSSGCLGLGRNGLQGLRLRYLGGRHCLQFRFQPGKLFRLRRQLRLQRGNFGLKRGILCKRGMRNAEGSCQKGDTKNGTGGRAHEASVHDYWC